MAKAPTYSAPKAYSSAYADQIASLVGNVANRGEFTYNPLQDANYQQLAKVYNANGLKAQQDTLGQAASLNGGYNTSYATSAAQQARNDYNQQLAALIPELEQNAYSRYADNFNMNISALGALQDADNTAYSKYRDTVSDAQWNYNNKYTQYRDSVADSQWQKEYNLSKKRAGRSGGGRSRSSGSGYSGSYSGGGVTSPVYDKAGVPKQTVYRQGNRQANAGTSKNVTYKNTSTGKTYKTYKNARKSTATKQK